MLAVRSGTRIWCKRCVSVVPVRNSDKRWLKCSAGHKIYAITVALMLSTDDDETPLRLLPPLHCRPDYWLEEMQLEVEAASKSLMAVTE